MRVLLIVTGVGLLLMGVYVFSASQATISRVSAHLWQTSQRLQQEGQATDAQQTHRATMAGMRNMIERPRGVPMLGSLAGAVVCFIAAARWPSATKGARGRAWAS